MENRSHGVAADQARLSHIDGLRGVAILGVMLFHAYARWPTVVPFGGRYASFPPFLYGWVGVPLFFLISGFVILMTLERSDGLANFLYRRWLRLFPAMFFCSLFVFFTSPFFSERPGGAPDWWSLLPGLTFIQPAIWSQVIGDVSPIEGAFWTIFIEVKFYIVFGALFFLLGMRRAVLAVVAIHLVSAGLGLANLPDEGVFHVIARLNDLLDGRSFGWFAAGALFYLHARDPDHRKLALAVGMALVAVASIPNVGSDGKVAALLVIALFVAGVTVAPLRALLGSRFLIFLGFVSYPLYLMHENMMISLVVKLGAALPWLSGLLLPVLSAVPIIAVSWLVAKYVEPWIRARLRPSSRRAATARAV